MELSKPAHSLSRAFYPISRIMNGVGVGILAVMMLLTAADVTLRYAFRRPIGGSVELSELMLCILVALGLAYALVHKEHIRIEFIISRFSPRVQAFVTSISALLGTGVFSLITWQSFLYAESLRTGGFTTGVLGIPIYPVVWVVVLGSAIFCLVLIVDLLEHLAELVAKERWWLRVTQVLGIMVVSVLFAMPILVEGMLPQVSPVTAGLLGLCLVIVLLFLGMHIGIATGLVGFLGMVYLTGLEPGLGILRATPYTTISSYTFSAIPLFILMGLFCFYSGLVRDLYFTMYRWLGNLPGGLAMATVGGCAGFAAVSGSALATVATLGTVALPEMKRYKYDSALATGCIAAGGSIGILIPPSIVFIIYGILTEQSIGRLFLAGFMPGILEALFYVITIYILCKRNPLMGPPGERVNFAQRLISLKGTWGVLVLFVLVIGGIYMGVFTPTEAAGVGAFGAFLFALGKRRLNWKSFTASLVDTGKTTAMMFFILIGTVILGYFLAVSGLPFELASFIGGLEINRHIILGIIILFYISISCFIPDIVVIVLTVPIIFPVIVALGFSPIWFGVIIVRMCEIGQITPPVGINVYIMKGVAKDIPMSTIFRGIVPFLIADIFHVALLVAVPQIALFLPNHMK